MALPAAKFRYGFYSQWRMVIIVLGMCVDNAKESGMGRFHGRDAHSEARKFCVEVTVLFLRRYGVATPYHRRNSLGEAVIRHGSNLWGMIEKL
jgi:hypothetical protein